MKIIVLYNLSEEENRTEEIDTYESAIIAHDTLKNNGHEVMMLGIHINELDKIKLLNCDLIFNLIEWTGEYSSFGVKATKIIKDTGIAYTGSDYKGYWLSTNKPAMKEKMIKEKIPTPKYMLFETGLEKISNLSFPVIVKPAYEHCGLGITQESVVDNEKRLRIKIKKDIEKLKQTLIVEEYIEGREIHVTILEKNGKPWVLPPAEVIFNKESGFTPILTYDCKWMENSKEYREARMEVAKIDNKLNSKIKIIAEKCYKRLWGKDYPRLDIRIRNNEIFVLEINNNPGIDYSMEAGIGISARAAGLTHGQLMEHIVNNAYLRQRNIYDTVKA